MTNKILFVDDEQNVLNGLKRQLGFDYDVTTANSGALGLQTIKEEGPFAVIVTDMRMPEMSGVEFLTHAHDLAPESIFMMLTGNQDKMTAIQAVNQGHIFRFLNKPCNNETMKSALDSALRQHQLEAGEKELLRKTLCGAVGVLLDILEGSHPECFSRSANMADLVGQLCTSLGVKNRWEYYMASKLSLIGFTLMPPSQIEAFLHAPEPDDTWLSAYRTASELGKRLIKRIPRLESVANMIEGQACIDGSTDWLPPTNTQQYEMAGATLVRITLHIEQLASCGIESKEGLEEICNIFPNLSHQLEDAIVQNWPDSDSQNVIQVNFKKLTVGMVLAEDIISEDGAVLVRKGRRLTETIITKLRCYDTRLKNQKPPMVFAHSCPQEDSQMAMA